METKVTARFRRWLRELLARKPCDLGRRGEDAAARELERRGYRLLARRWRCRLGEIDIVAEDGGVLVVVEVKTRASSRFGPPIDAVDRDKRRRLERLARAYRKARGLGDVTVRFDLVGVTMAPGERPRIEVYPGALSFR